MSFNSLKLASSAWAGACTAVGTVLDRFLFIGCLPCLGNPLVTNKCEEICPLFYFSPQRIVHEVVLKLFIYLEWKIA